MMSQKVLNQVRKSIKINGSIFMEGGDKCSDDFTIFQIIIRHRKNLSLYKKEAGACLPLPHDLFIKQVDSLES